MSTYSSYRSSYSEVKDPELKKFVDQVIDMLKATTYQSIYNRSQKKTIPYNKIKVGVKKVMEYESVGSVIDQWIGNKKQEQIVAVSNNSGVRRFVAGNLNSGLKALNIKSKNYILDSVDYKKEFHYLNDNLLLNRFGNIFGVDTSTSPANNATTPGASVLKLNLNRVKCLDETDPEWGGKDKIACGGVTIDDKQVEAKIAEFIVGDFNDNDQKVFNPVKVLKSFVLDNTQPSTFSAFVSIAEKDSNGFSDFLNSLYEAIKAHLTEILSALGAAAGAAIGVAIGGSIGATLGGPIGAIIGIVAGLILGGLIGWLVDIFKDDVFEPQITVVTLNQNLPFTGPIEKLTYQDFGGTYLAEVFWSAN